MKDRRTISLLIAFALLMLVMTACNRAYDHGTEGSETEVTWQEQYDLGIRYLSEGNYEKAIIAFTAAIEIDPKQAPAYVGRGDAYVLSGETEENLSAAKADYERAIELDETNAEAYLGLADVYIRQGNDEKALEILEQGLNVTGNSMISEKLFELYKERQSEHEQFEQLLNEGKSDNMLSFEEITFLGEPLHEFTVEEIVSKMSAMGMDIYENNEGDHYYVQAHFEPLSSGPSVSALQGKNSSYVSLFGYDSGVTEGDVVAIGIRDLMTQGTIAQLFSALGFSNASKISDYFYGLVEVEYDSYDAILDIFHQLQYSDETLQIYFSSVGGTQNENGTYSVEDMVFSLYLHGNQNYRGSYNFDFTFGWNFYPGFEDCLTSYSIYYSN